MQARRRHRPRRRRPGREAAARVDRRRRAARHTAARDALRGRRRARTSSKARTRRSRCGPSRASTDGPEVDVTPWTVFTSSDPSAVTIERRRHDHRDRPPPRAARRHRPVPRSRRTAPRHATARRQAGRSLGGTDGEPDRRGSHSHAHGAANAGLAAGRRRDVPPPRPPRPDRHAAHAGGSGSVRQGPRRRQTREARRSTCSRATSSPITGRCGSRGCSRVHSLPNEKEGMQAYTKWLRTRIRDGMPLDKWARELLTATGDSHAVGPANFARTVERRARAGRTREPGVPRRAVAVRELPQPPARPLDAGRLPRPRRGVRASSNAAAW